MLVGESVDEVAPLQGGEQVGHDAAPRRRRRRWPGSEARDCPPPTRAADTNRRRVSAQAAQVSARAFAVTAGGRPRRSSGNAAPVQTAARCVNACRLTSPGPETTSSRETRPRSAANAAANASSRGVRAAKSACPPSEAIGISRPPTRCRPASPSPVPGAISAALPRAAETPGRRATSSCAASSGIAQAIASTSLSRWTDATPKRRPISSASARPRDVGQLRDPRSAPVPPPRSRPPPGSRGRRRDRESGPRGLRARRTQASRSAPSRSARGGLRRRRTAPATSWCPRRPPRGSCASSAVACPSAVAGGRAAGVGLGGDPPCRRLDGYSRSSSTWWYSAFPL